MQSALYCSTSTACWPRFVKTSSASLKILLYCIGKVWEHTEMVVRGGGRGFSSPQRTFDETRFYVAQGFQLRWICVVSGRMKFKSTRGKLLVTPSVPFAAIRLVCRAQSGWLPDVLIWSSGYLCRVSPGLLELPASYYRKCLWGWCSQLERRVVEACLTLQGSSSQVAAEAQN